MAEHFLGGMERGGNYDRNRNADHQLPIGTVLGGQYMIGKALGQGGFGITYLAWDQTMGEPVAVKEYFPKGFASRTAGNTRVTSYDGQNAHDFEFNKKRFLREAESLAKLWNIPQIVKILRYFEENGTAYIVMEYVQGVDLRQHLKKQGRPLTMEETLALMGPVVEGLDLVHKINLVHRDISPDNIMVLPDGSTKLLDFGAARYVENADAEQQRQSSTQQVLKHGFAPPEQYSSHGALGPWTDVYALCGTVYYCLTGKLPPEAMDRGYSGAVIPWDRIPDLTPGQKTALEKGMALQPKERFASARELWNSLNSEPPKQAKSIAQEKTSVKAESSKPAPKFRKNLLLCAIALCVFVGVNGLGKSTDPAINVMETQVQETDPPVIFPEPNISCTFEENKTGWTITGYVGDKNNLPGDIILPGEKEGIPVTSIGDSAFSGCNRLSSVTIPNSVTSIGDSAFRGCDGLTSVTIPDSVTSVGNLTFYGCSRLTSVTIPDSVTSIGNLVFYGCRSLTSVTIPGSVTSVGNGAFSNCRSLTSVTIPGSVTSIDESAFQDCGSLTSVTISDGVTSIGNLAFFGCSSLSSVTIPGSVTYIGDSAFWECSSLWSVTISKNCTNGDRSFPYGCTVNRR